jgi:DNA-binding protein HU-beta
VNKERLVRAVAAEAGLKLVEADKAVDAVMGIIKGAVANGDRVALLGFGSFERKLCSARTGRNPQTGEVLEIPERMAVRFHPSKDFKETVQ